jgi:hypothetical protein
VRRPRAALGAARSERRRGLSPCLRQRPPAARVGEAGIYVGPGVGPASKPVLSPLGLRVAKSVGYGRLPSAG